ncbi:MAG TPA: hypothetical protein VMT88_12515, partial [Actinomycetes bacterium]|nr:hypothetical protein [Actinomycetes bacterium]
MKRNWWLGGLAIALPFVLLGAGIVWWLGGVGTLVGREQCEATSRSGSVSLDPEQAEQAATISAVAIKRGLPMRALTVGQATALQESKLHNVESGDHDSAG